MRHHPSKRSSCCSTSSSDFQSLPFLGTCLCVQEIDPLHPGICLTVGDRALNEHHPTQGRLPLAPIATHVIMVPIKGIRYSIGRELFTYIPSLNSGLPIFKIYNTTFATGVGMRSTHHGVSSTLATYKGFGAVNPSALSSAPEVSSLITQDHHLRTTENATRPTLSMHQVDQLLGTIANHVPLLVEEVRQELRTHESPEGNHPSGWLRLRRRKQVRRGLRQGAAVWVQTRHSLSLTSGQRCTSHEPHVVVASSLVIHTTHLFTSL